MICPKCNHQFKDPARVKGGLITGGRKITSEEAKRMVRIREEKRAKAKIDLANH